MNRGVTVLSAGALMLLALVGLLWTMWSHHAHRQTSQEHLGTSTPSNATAPVVVVEHSRDILPIANSPVDRIRLRGCVRYKNGQAISNARIEIVWVEVVGQKEGRTALSADTEGRYSASLPHEMDITVSAYAGIGNLWGISTGTVSRGENIIDVEIEPEARLQVFTTDPSGLAIPATVWVQDPFGYIARRPVGLPEEQKYQSDARGQVVVDHLVPVSPVNPFVSLHTRVELYAITVMHPGYRTEYSKTALYCGLNTLRVTLSPVPAGVHVSGVVRTTDDRPVSCALVQWEYVRATTSVVGPVDGQQSTAANGSFDFDVPGVNLWFAADGRLDGQLSLRGVIDGLAETYFDLADVRAGVAIRDVVIKLEPGDLTVGRVIDPGGAPIPDAKVSVTRCDGDLTRGETGLRTALDGSFRIVLPKTGTYRFWASKEGFDGAVGDGGDLGTVRVCLPQPRVELTLQKDGE